MKKGPWFEAAVVTFLRAVGFPRAERRVQGGANDKGDIAGIDGWTLELKNVNSPSLGAWVDEAEREAINAGTPWFAVIHKRRGKGQAKDAFVTMPLHVFARLLDYEEASA